MTTAVAEKPATKPVKAPKAASKPAEVPSASVEEPQANPAADSRYPAQEVCEEIAAGVKAARDAGWTRPRLVELVTEAGGSAGGSMIWRTEQGRVHVDEVPYVQEVLAKIQSGELTLPAKETKDPSKLRTQVTGALELLGTADELKKISELRELIKDVREALGG